MAKEKLNAFDMAHHVADLLHLDPLRAHFAINPMAFYSPLLSFSPSFSY